MASTVRQLDTSGWSQEALDRLHAMRARIEATKAYKASVAYIEAVKAFDAAKAAHPFANALEGLTQASREASEAPKIKFLTRNFGNGHREAVVMRVIPDPAKTLERAIERDLRAIAPRGMGDREASQESAARRAKQDVRHKCKAMAINALWTLTFRENVTDREVALRCLDRFRRLVVKHIPGWRYIAVLEKQKRGAWHIHIATHALPKQLTDKGVKVKSWNVMRGIWRKVAGGLGGNFDEAKRKGRWGTGKPMRGAGAIARYIAGYVAKDMRESELNRKRYSASKGIEVPDAYRALFDGETSMAELITLAYAAVGDNVVTRWYDADRGVFYIETDDSGLRTPLPV